MRNLPTAMGVADFLSVCSSRDCQSFVAVSFTEAMTKSKRKRKALSIEGKVNIVKQLKSSSVAIIAERYELYKELSRMSRDLTFNFCCMCIINAVSLI